MHFYEDLFGMKYQFSKFDMVFLPDFPGGAMENVGLVTNTEGLFYATKD
jgi:aminopeptidase N